MASINTKKIIGIVSMCAVIITAFVFGERGAGVATTIVMLAPLIICSMNGRVQ